MSFEKYVKNTKAYYKNLSIKKEIDINNFLNNFIIIEKIGLNDLINISHNEQQYRKDDYLWFLYNQKILENKIIEEKGFSTLFLTLTLSSSFHKYSKTSKRKNPKYNESCTIESGYKLLNDSFREIYKNFRVNRQFKKIYYCKVFKPHKNFTPHLHAILYVKSEFKEALIQHIKNIIKKNELGKSFDIEEIQDLAKSSSYLLKYVRKNTNAKAEESFRVFNGWKKAHKIRVFTCSILAGLERFLYKKIKNNTSITRDLKENPIIKILNECNIEITTTCKTTKQVKTKINKVDNAKFSIEVQKERVQTKDKKELDSIKDFIETLENDFLYCAKNDKLLEDCLLDSSKFDLFAFKKFGNNEKFLNVANSCYIEFLDNFTYSKSSQFFKNFYNELYKNVKNIHTYKVVDLKIFEYVQEEKINKYDKKDFYITNTTKKDNWVKRAIFDIKHEKVKNEKNS